MMVVHGERTAVVRQSLDPSFNSFVYTLAGRALFFTPKANDSEASSDSPNLTSGQGGGQGAVPGMEGVDAGNTG